MNKLLTGFALGLIVGVLYAPDKGTATRRKISNNCNDIKNQVADFIDNVAERFENTSDEDDDYIDVPTEKARTQAVKTI